MKNRQISGVLVTLVVAAALLAALGAEARAGGVDDRFNQSYSHSKLLKPSATPMAGEPDSPNSGPLPPKVGPYPTGGATLSNWALRFHWSLRLLLLQLSSRLP
jgi:hypothetical protein